MKNSLDNIRVISIFNVSRGYGRPKVERKLLKLLWFIVNEGLSLTVRKAITARAYRKMLDNGKWILFRDSDNILRLGVLFNDEIYYDEFRIISDRLLDILSNVDDSKYMVAHIVYGFHIKDHFEKRIDERREEISSSWLR